VHGIPKQRGVLGPGVVDEGWTSAQVVCEE
jgi:hypothetical protein